MKNLITAFIATAKSQKLFQVHLLSVKNTISDISPDWHPFLGNISWSFGKYFSFFKHIREPLISNKLPIVPDYKYAPIKRPFSLLKNKNLKLVILTYKKKRQFKEHFRCFRHLSNSCGFWDLLTKLYRYSMFILQVLAEITSNLFSVYAFCVDIRSQVLFWDLEELKFGGHHLRQPAASPLKLIQNWYRNMFLMKNNPDKLKLFHQNLITTKL